MRITILTYGSRGDVQPFLALAVGLQKRGHQVLLAAPHRFAEFIAAYGVACAPLAGDPDVLSQILNDAGGNVYGMIRGMRAEIMRIAPEVVQSTRQALQGADLVVHSFLFTTGAHSFARELGIPDVSVQAFPAFVPTRAFPNVVIPGTPPGWFNYFSHWFFTQVFWHGGNSGYYQMRRQAPAVFPKQLYWPFAPTTARPPTALAFAYSPAILPQPEDWPAPPIHVTGYLFLDHPEYAPPPALRAFLEAGPAPVCITFGSMVNREAERVTRAILAGLARTGQRAIFLTGWGGRVPDNPPADTLFLDAAPHDWLFPQCRTLVHHGGAGTTGAGLRAGVPALVVPHGADQPFWGARVFAVGAGPRPIPVQKLTAEAFAAALTVAESSAMRARAAELGRAVRAEDGVGALAALIERHAEAFGRKA